MKIILRIITLLLVSNNIINAQAPNWAWAQDPGSGGGTGIAADANGNIYVTGFFDTQSINFGNTTLTNAGSSNAFLTKYDASGNVIWATGAGGGGNIYAYAVGGAVCTDANGNAFITGYYGNGNLIIGSDTLIYPDTGMNIFIAKFDSSGNVVWANYANALNSASFTSIRADISGNVYATGFYSGSNVIFGNDTLTFTGGSSYAENTFIVKYDTSGNLIWAKNAAGNSSGSGINTSANGYVYVTGGFSGPDIIFGNDTLVSAGNPYSFLVKYDSTGNVIWAEGAGGSGGNAGDGVSTDMNGNVYVTGWFDSTIIFGSDTLISVLGYNAVAHVTDQGAFIVKYDASGNVVWAKSSGVSENAFASAISSDANGNSYVTGFYSNPAITFGMDTLIYALADTGGSEIFVVKYDTSGSVVWAKSAVGGSLSLPDFSYVGSTISTDASGNSYLGGWFSSPFFTFDDINLNYVQGGASYENIFVAKLSAFPTSIADVKKPVNTINVFPNPSTGAFNFTGVPIGSTMQVYNVLGEMVSSSVADNSIYYLYLHEAKGIYFYRIVNTDNVIAKGKIVLK